MRPRRRVLFRLISLVTLPNAALQSGHQRLHHLAMASALTRAETEDFAAARAPPQAPQVLDDTATAASSTDSIKRRFTFKRLSHKRDAIVETALEDAGSPSSTLAGSCLYPSSTMNGRVDVKPAVGPMDFDLLCVIGQGAFGKVIQVRHVPTDEVLAMKVGTKWLHKMRTFVFACVSFCFLFQKLRLKVDTFWYFFLLV